MLNRNYFSAGNHTLSIQRDNGLHVRAGLSLLLRALLGVLLGRAWDGHRVTRRNRVQIYVTSHAVAPIIIVVSLIRTDAA